MNVDMAKRLADRRRRAGLTQEGLAERLNVSRQAVSKWERSESSPDTDNLIALAQLYEVSLDELLYEDVCEDSFTSEPDGTDTPSESQSAAFCDASATSEFDSPSSCDADDAANSSDDSEDSDTASRNASSNSSASEETTGEGFGFASDDGTFHIGADGIHVEDGKDYVHINWRDGVNVFDGKKGDSVHVGWDGVRVNDTVYSDLEDANEALGVKSHFYSSYKKPSNFAKAWNRFPFPLVIILAYILVGVFLNQWDLGLFLFFTIPVYYLIGTTIDSKRIGPFLAGLYPLGVLAWFLYMAFCLNEPHPAWVMFLTIPLFEWLIVSLSHWYRKRKKARV